MKFLRVVAAPFFLAGFVAASAAAEQLGVKSYTTVEGLPSDRINCILRDSHGFLWFGTWDGISRFDGYGFENLTSGLPGPSVNALLESRDGTFWAATNGGLAHWDPNRPSGRAPRKFEILAIAPGAGAGVQTLVEDRRGALWIGGNAGLYRLETAADRKPRKVLFEDPEPTLRGVYALLEDRQHDLWIGAESGLYKRSAAGPIKRIADRRGQPTDIRCLLEDRSGGIWIGTHTAGIFRARREPGWQGWVVEPFSSFSGGLAGNHVVDLFQSSDGTVWAGCYGGLSCFPPGSERPRSYSTAQGLPALGIFAVGEDPAANLWIGTDDAGVARLARGGFRTYDARDGLVGTRVVSLFRDRNGEVCVTSAGTKSEVLSDTGRLLECFDGQRFRVVKPRIPASTRLGWGWAQVAFQDRRGEWWIPSFEGLYRFPAIPLARLATAAPRVYTTSDGLPSNEIFRLYESESGDVWMSLSSSDRRLARWVRANESFQSFSSEDGLPVDSPIAFADDGAGGLWIGYYEGGVARLSSGRFTFFSEKDGIPAGRIRALHRDRAGRIWIGSSRGGVGRVDHPGRFPLAVRTYTTRDRLTSNNIWSFAEDRWGRLYIGTERGLDRLDPESGNVQTFTSDDGLVRGVIEEGLEDGRGDLWFGSSQGLSRLTPEPTELRSPPPIRIARVLVGGVRQDLPGLGATHLRLPDLGPRAGGLQIDYLGIDFAAGGGPRYQYRLEGADPEWGPPVEQRSVIYASLRPGAYRFQVRAIRNDGSTSREPADVAFRILPPFWQRPGFVAVGLAALAAAAYGLHRYRLRGALALERIRTRIATDLHDDIGSSLSQIAILAEIARQQPDDGIPKIRQTLSRIAGVSRSVVDSLGDTIWAIDPQKDRLPELVHRMRRFAGDLLAEQHIELCFQASVDDHDRDLASDVRRHLYLIFKEALHNVVRHSGCTRVEIEFRVEGKRICLRVSDNGRGFDPTRPGEGYGMASIRSRASELGGTVEVLTAVGSGAVSPGTTLRLAVPLHK